MDTEESSRVGLMPGLYEHGKADVRAAPHAEMSGKSAGPNAAHQFRFQAEDVSAIASA